MTADVPRHLVPTQGQRGVNVYRTHAAQSLGGSTAAARPVQNTTPTPRIYTPPSASTASADRVVVTKDVTLTGSPTTVPSWQAVHEAVGTSVSVASPDDGSIHINTAGVYALTVEVFQPFMHSATVDCSVYAQIYNDSPTPTTHLWILPTAQLRGGGGEIATSSSVQFCPAGMVLRAQVVYDHADPTLVSGATVWVIVQRIS